MAASGKAVASRFEQLQAHEERIEKSLDDAFHSLRTIHDEQLYKEDGYTNFKDYCEQRWGYSKSYGHRLIDHSRIVDYLKEQGAEILPSSEGQTRALGKLRRKAKTDEEFLEKAAHAWQVAVDTAPRKQDVPQVTGDHVESAMTHFGITKNIKKPDDAEIDDLRRSIKALSERRLVSKMTGTEFVEKHGAKLGDKHTHLLEWLIDYDQAAMDAADE